MNDKYDDIRLVITDINDGNKEEKLVKAISSLSKAMKVYTAIDIEPLKDGGPAKTKEEPLQVVQQLADEIAEEHLKTINKVYEELIRFVGGLRKAGVERFKLPKGIYNPKTGKPLTQKEWKQVVGAIDNYLGSKTEDLAERATMRAAAVGAVLNRLEKEGTDVEKLTLKDVRRYLPKKAKFLDVQKQMKWRPEAAANLKYRIDNLGNYITSLNDDMRADIKGILIEGLAQQKDVGEIERDLFDAHSEWNRDWKRIAMTETQNSVTDGHMVHEISMSEKGELMYMIGVSGGKACKICLRDINNKVVRLLPKPPAGGNEYIDDPYTNAAIWVGKNSIGHTAKETWTCVTRHPHCGCRFVRYYP